MSEEQGLRLLAVYSHPDDESFVTGGSLARYAHEGVEVSLVCATRGEVGEISDPALATPATLGKVREGELRSACRLLGIRKLRFLDYVDGTLPEMDQTQAVGKIAVNVRELGFDAMSFASHKFHGPKGVGSLFR